MSTPKATCGHLQKECNLSCYLVRIVLITVQLDSVYAPVMDSLQTSSHHADH